MEKLAPADHWVTDGTNGLYVRTVNSRWAWRLASMAGTSGPRHPCGARVGRLSDSNTPHSLPQRPPHVIPSQCPINSPFWTLQTVVGSTGATELHLPKPHAATWTLFLRHPPSLLVWHVSRVLLPLWQERNPRATEDWAPFLIVTHLFRLALRAFISASVARSFACNRNTSGVADPEMGLGTGASFSRSAFAFSPSANSSSNFAFLF